MYPQMTLHPPAGSPKALSPKHKSAAGEPAVEAKKAVGDVKGKTHGESSVIDLGTFFPLNIYPSYLTFPQVTVHFVGS